jgi:hypothetical protein
MMLGSFRSNLNIENGGSLPQEEKREIPLDTIIVAL